MRFNNLLIVFGVAALSMGLSACNDDESSFGSVNLGTLESEIVVSSEAGIYDFEVCTNYDYHADLIGDADWLDIAPGKPAEDVAVVSIKYDANEGFNRMVKIVLVSDVNKNICDTIYFKQRAGLEPILSFNDLPTVHIAGEGGKTKTSISTNIPVEDMAKETEIEYIEKGEEWLTSFDIDLDDSGNSILIITALPNTATTPRTAVVRFAFTDGWDISCSATLTVLQANKDEEYFTSVSFEEMLNNYATGESISDYIGVKGIVVSNKEQGNAGQPVHTTGAGSIDFTPAARTIYFESEDAKYGIAIIADNGDDNIFDQFDRVTLVLNGATLTKKFSDRDDCPTRYEMTDFDPTMAFSRVAGDSAPEKNKTINELTDDDIYTYVTLNEVELPIRKGGLFPTDAVHTSSGGNQRITKFPVLVRGKDGGSMYLLTNDRCLYYRDGTQIPHGSGSLRGVVVHEHFSGFEWENGYTTLYSDIEAEETKASLGYIGKYQIRHQTKGDILDGLSEDFEASFSGLICEYRWRVIVDTDNTTSKFGTTIDVPSYGTNGWITHTYQTNYTASSSKDYTGSNGSHFYTVISTDYLGPCGTDASTFYGKNVGNKNGLGIIVDRDKENWETYMPDRFAYNDGSDGSTEGCRFELACPYAENQYCGYGGAWKSGVNGKSVPNDHSSSGNQGKGWTNASAMVTLGSHYWWDDDEDNKPYGYLLFFSTKNISSDIVSLQLAMRNNGDALYCPRFWCVEWSESDVQWGDGADWNRIAEFTLTDNFSSTYTKRVWQFGGFKQMNFTLPNEILGKENVYIRICPTSDLCSGGSEYADKHLRESASKKAEAAEHASYISYIAVRYNK